MTHFRTRKQRTRGTSSSVHAAEQKPIFSVPKERRRSTVQMGSATPLSQLLTPVNTPGVMSEKSGAPRAAFYFYVSFYPPSQKTTAVRLWMNARGGPSEVPRSGTKEGASADFAEEMKPPRAYARGGFIFLRSIPRRYRALLYQRPMLIEERRLFSKFLAPLFAYSSELEIYFAVG